VEVLGREGQCGHGESPAGGPGVAEAAVEVIGKQVMLDDGVFKIIQAERIGGKCTIVEVVTAVIPGRPEAGSPIRFGVGRVGAVAGVKDQSIVVSFFLAIEALQSVAVANQTVPVTNTCARIPEIFDGPHWITEIQTVGEITHEHMTHQVLLHVQSAGLGDGILTIEHTDIG
jgi:hypothetical protein